MANLGGAAAGRAEVRLTAFSPAAPFDLLVSAIEELSSLGLYVTMRSILDGGVRLIDPRIGDTVRCLAAGWRWAWNPERLPAPGVARPLIAHSDFYITYGGAETLCAAAHTLTTADRL